MTTEIVNLTWQSVHRKIEETLEKNSECAYSQAFADPDLQQKLMTYVLKRVHNCYVTIESDQEAVLERMINTELQCHQLDCLIRQGMKVLRSSSSNWVPNSRLPVEPSHWFG